MGKYFGTDGVRGVANQQLTPELAFRLGRCGAYVLTKGKQRPKIVIGRDTRLSGEMLEASLMAGMLSMGCDVVRLGVVSTPGVAFLTRHLEADAGVMISASHNPFEDNGIKFFGADGYKLLDEVEAEIEQLLDAKEDELPRPAGDQIGRITDDRDAVKAYLEHLKSTIDTDLCGMHIVVDCANGAAYELAPHLLRDLGADVTAMSVHPDGTNINVDCGSTHPERLRQEVLNKQAHLGLAFDGDADRLIAVDEKGNLIDGDMIMSICAGYMKEKGELNGNTVVTTVMSNIGFFKAMDELGIKTERTKVGDRYVMEKMREGGYNLGGEQSGHIIFLNHNTTGDGMLTAVQLLRVVKDKAQTLSDLARVMKQYPQVLVNVRVHSKEGWEQNEAIQNSIREVEKQLGNDGRVLVRASGTEPLIRVMAEGPDEQIVKNHVEKIADVVRNQLGS
ncbi:phosphoglucosamine mutase [Laceyella sacchari]|jgi:phosphoglucosamine mutase|uniref:Phosphoglucosamine mutase n=2 Tax=Laceyella TaxID=292635 RepID=A0AA46AH70_9BACL|nr:MULTISPECIES: phosphoglucosamine mutase [Laceyella]AUS07678.1 phosphoglucosamine mutase [Laceyella sacchari]MRG27517.1 phosphoglucosamine mutase [Laceyella tengchongensis]PRZ11994.1 phosphoglucosamine mutase [Laceyella sediminis]SMP35115.1 phosphoglucosamine mutase [Laceyella tengchongensis]